MASFLQRASPTHRWQSFVRPSKNQMLSPARSCRSTPLRMAPRQQIRRAFATVARTCLQTGMCHAFFAAHRRPRCCFLCSDAKALCSAETCQREKRNQRQLPRPVRSPPPARPWQRTLPRRQPLLHALQTNLPTGNLAGMWRRSARRRYQLSRHSLRTGRLIRTKSSCRYVGWPGVCCVYAYRRVTNIIPLASFHGKRY